MDLLQVHQLFHPHVAEDVVTAADARTTEPECLRQRHHVIEADVLRAGKNPFQCFAWSHLAA
jgi:hypothetical protein